MTFKKDNIFVQTLDPVYIGTGGYSIGRVDNTIVRDKVTNLPKIPGSSLAGNWRYYMALKLQDKLKETDRDINDAYNYGDDDEDKNYSYLSAKLRGYIENSDGVKKWFDNDNKWLYHPGNAISRIKCAGQDDTPNIERKNKESKEGKIGHCGHCIVCKTFGYSKASSAQRGRTLFSDLNILFFPVNTYMGVKWITSPRVLNDAGLNNDTGNIEKNKVKIVKGNGDNDEDNINLGYLNLPIQDKSIELDLDSVNCDIQGDIKNNLIIVPNNLFSQIVNANLEVRTSNSINPITGAAKGGALFTSEAIPRLTVLMGNVRIEDDRKKFEEDKKENSITNYMIHNALEKTKDMFEVMGIGGMSTRGYGRIKVSLEDEKKSEEEEDNNDAK